MLKLIHKYFRRVIVWAQTPSAEEVTGRRLQHDMRNANNILKSRGGPVFLVEHQGMERSEVIRTCRLFLKLWESDGNVSEVRAWEACENLCKTNRLDFVALVRSGEILSPFGLLKGVAA